MSKLECSFPMPPRVTNRKSNSRWTGHSEKKSYAKQLDELQHIGLIPPPPREAWTKSSIASVMHLGAAMDDDNAMARHKPLLDWLKTRGYIVDDRKKNLVWEGLPTQVIRRARPGEHYRIVLTMQSL
jgi:hypothetical protein